METKGMIQQKTAEVAKAAKNKTIKDYIRAMEGEIAKALPSVMTPERFTRITLSALSSNPDLQGTTPASFLGAMMTAAQLGLEPNTPLGQAYLIPYKNKGTLECQFQLGYRGMIDLAYRSGEVQIIQAHIVYANDKFDFSFGIDPKLNHVPALGERGEATHVYAMFRTKDGGYGFDVMTIDDVRRHASKYSKSYSSSYSPWNTNFEEMAKKTVLKRVLKYAPLKSDFARAVAADGSIKTEIDSDMLDVTPKMIEVDGEVVDTSTGEIMQEDESNE